MERQSALGLAFEYLIGNASPSENDLLYLLEESRVMCVDHSRTFPTASIDVSLPGELEPEFIEALESLDGPALKGTLGDLLSDAQIDALLQRRDVVLQHVAGRRGSSSRPRLFGPQPLRAGEFRARGSLAARNAQAEDARSPQGWPIERKEQFLLNATVVETKLIGEGITKPKKVKLELDGVTLNAAFKYHEEFRPGVTQFDQGPRELNFRDSYLFDRAAYLLDRELGMGMVPVTVLREVEGDAGALVENTDENLHNQLVTVHDWKVHLIDLTRAFRFSRKLPEEFEEKPVSLPRGLYQRLQDLKKDRLMTLMDGVLSKTQVRAILARRDAILAKIDRDIRARGEQAVFQD
jgi:hypothetical protein